MDVETYIQHQQSSPLRDLFHYCRDHPAAIGNNTIDATATPVTAPDADTIPAFIYTAVMFGYKWQQTADVRDHLPTDTGIDEFLATTHPPVLRETFEYLHTHHTAFLANDLNPDDLDLSFTPAGTTTADQLNLTPFLLDAIKFGILWGDALAPTTYYLGHDGPTTRSHASSSTDADASTESESDSDLSQQSDDS